MSGKKKVLFIAVTLGAISLLSLVAQFYIAKGVICGYVEVLPYTLPISYLLGLLTAIVFEEKVDIHKIVGRVLLKLVTDEAEKEAIRIAIKGGTQAELAKKFGKIKASRVVKRLENKGIIRREKKGLTYKLRISEKLLS